MFDDLDFDALSFLQKKYNRDDFHIEDHDGVVEILQDEDSLKQGKIVYKKDVLNRDIDEARLLGCFDYAERLVKDYAEQMRISLVKGTKQLERDTWGTKAERARRFLSGEQTGGDTLALDVEIKERGLGETKEQLCKIQLAKEASLSLLTGTIDGMQSRALKNIKEFKENKDLQGVGIFLQELQLYADGRLKEVFEGKVI